MKKISVIIAFLFLLAGGPGGAAQASCEEEKVNVIFDTDMGNDVDDALALDMLYKYLELKKADLLGIMISKNNRFAAEFTDIMASWYGHTDIPVGIVKNGTDDELEAVNYAQIVSEMQENGAPVFERFGNSYELLPEASKLYRKILSTQPDHSVTIISVGFFTNLAQLLETDADEFSDLNGKGLVTKKVKYLTVMAGSFGKNAIASYNVRKDIQSAAKVFSEWPTRIVASPAEVGIKIRYPASSIMNDFNWTKLHPMVEAYKVYLPMPYDRPTWDLTNLLYAIDNSYSYLEESVPGTIIVDEQGYTHFHSVTDGKHCYLSVSGDKVDVIRDYFVNLIRQKPLKYKQDNE